MGERHANSSFGSWQNVNDVLQTFSSLSRISKGNSPLQNAENKKETTINRDVNNYRSNGSTYCTDSTGIPTLSMPYRSSSHQRIHSAVGDEETTNGMGRGRLLRNLEMKFTENSFAELDKRIHSELTEINCAYSNDAIERHWGSSSSPTEFAQDEVINTDEDPLEFNFVMAVNNPNKNKEDNSTTGKEKHIDGIDCTDEKDELKIIEENNKENIVERKDKVEILGERNDIEVVEERELIEGISTLSMETNNNRMESVSSTLDTDKVEVVSREDVTKNNTSDTKEAAVSSDKISKKSKRKCRNLILLNLSSPGVAETVPKMTLKQPDAFLKPPVKSSYSAALGLKQPLADGSAHGKSYGSMFSQADFPPL